MVEEISGQQYAEDPERPTFKDQLYGYLRWYPLFIASLLASLVIAFLYIRYTIPKFNVHTQMLVKADFSGSSNSGSKDLVETALNGSKINPENELQLLQSQDLLERVILKNGLNILYYKVGNVLDVEVYKDVPFKTVAQFVTDSSRAFSFNVTMITRQGGICKYGDEKQRSQLSFHWNIPFAIQGQTIVLVSRGVPTVGAVNYKVRWVPVDQLAADLHKDFSVTMLDNKTSIIDINLLVENVDKGKDILNNICSEYILTNINDKKQLAENTLRFIDERLNLASENLGGVEGNLEKYQSANGITNIDLLSTTTLANSNTSDKELLDINNQQGIVEMITRYVSNPNYRNKLVPSSLGLNDATLTSMILHYNELQLKKDKELPYVQAESEIIKDFNNQIDGVRVSILESLQNIAKNLKFREERVKQENEHYLNTMSSIPHKERVMQDIKRKQSITEGLYLYLLQKREEVAISNSNVNKPDYVQIDNATGNGPVEPNNKKIWIMSVIAGLLLPIAALNLRRLLDDKINGKNDILTTTSLTILGEINHVAKKSLVNGLVTNGSIESEQFRMLRTRISLMQRDTDKKIWMVTSSTSNEGKSFISLNLAAMMAITGKKVALVDFDMRKPNISTHVKKNLSCYLTGKIKDLSVMSERVHEAPNLNIFKLGVADGNPSDFLLGDRLEELFASLRRQYDFIIINSAPISLYADAYIVGGFAESTIFIVRQGYTPRKNLSLLKELAKTQDDLFIVLNDKE